MECEEYGKFGILFLYDELEASEKKRFETHMEVCELCRSRIKSHGQVREKIRGIAIEKAPELDLKRLYLRTGSPASHFVDNLSSLLTHPIYRYIMIGATLMILFFSYTLVVRRDDHENNSAKHPDALAWDWKVDATLKDIEIGLDDVRNPGGILLELNGRIERRWAQETLYKVRELYSFENEIEDMKSKINYF